MLAGRKSVKNAAVKIVYTVLCKFMHSIVHGENVMYGRQSAAYNLEEAT